MDWLDVTEWHPVNNDIIPNDNDKHEDNTLLPSKREGKKVLSNQTVDNPLKLKTMNLILLMMRVSYKIIMCI